MFSYNNKEGFKGVFGQIAIHLRKERTEMVDVDCISILVLIPKMK
jgi:hypothetical protein